jgi:uncharacterized protein (TIGR04141 family)
MVSTDSPIEQAERGRRKSPSRRTTLYRLHGLTPGCESLLGALNLRYRDEQGFELASVSVGDVACVLYTGVIRPSDAPEWAAAVHALTGESPDVRNWTSAGALLIPVDDDVFALTYGMGNLFLNQSRVEAGFGLQVVLRTLRPEAVRQVTHLAMDARGRTDRNSAAQDQHIRSFGIEEYGEIVSRLTGQLDSDEHEFSIGSGKSLRISGTDSLKVPLGRRPADMLADLAKVTEMVNRESMAPEFDLIARIRPLKNTDDRRAELDERLDELLGKPCSGSIAVTVPTELLDEEDSAMSYRVKIGSQHELVGELDSDAVLARAAEFDAGSRLSALKKGHIQMYRDINGQYAASAQVKAHKWIVAEVSLGSNRFFMHEGNWYEVGDKHAEFVTQQVRELLDDPVTLPLIDWSADLEDEAAYNEAAARTYGYVCMDRVDIHTNMARRDTFEACDLLGPGNELVHVKRAAGTAPLNQLFSQGRYSAQLLRQDAAARHDFVAKVRARDPNHEIADDFMPEKLVYAISLKSGKPLSVENLFTFAQVTLLQSVSALRYDGTEVSVANIQASSH